MKVKDADTCISPWLGLLMITIICLVMTIAVFIEFRGPGSQKKYGDLSKKNMSLHGAPGNAHGSVQGNGMQVAYTQSGAQEKLTF